MLTLTGQSFNFPVSRFHCIQNDGIKQDDGKAVFSNQHGHLRTWQEGKFSSLPLRPATEFRHSDLHINQLFTNSHTCSGVRIISTRLILIQRACPPCSRSAMHIHTYIHMYQLFPFSYYPYILLSEKTETQNQDLESWKWHPVFSLSVAVRALL